MFLAVIKTTVEDYHADHIDVLRNHHPHVLSPAEHNPPHIHAYYQNFMAIVDILTGEVSAGSIPPKQTKLVLAWVEIHKEELLADWDLASKGELPFPIDPLK